MQTRTLALCVLASVVCPCAAGAFTMTFDDIPAGGDLAYYRDLYGVPFQGPFYVADHTASVWGQPHSPPNVLKWSGGTADLAWVHVGGPGRWHVDSVTARVSTQADVVLRMAGYLARPHGPFPKVVERLIGAPGEAWENVYVELRAEDGSPFDFVAFEAVSSPDARLHFCIDDMTVTPVPEPSSLASLSLAILSAGAGVRWRRRR